MLKRYAAPMLLALLAFACAQGWNRWNLAAMLRSDVAKASVRAGGSVITADDASYLQEVEKALGHRPDLELGIAARRPILRPPGYGWWYMLPRLALAPEQAIAALILLQCLLFACSVALLHEALLAHGIAPLIRWPLLILLAVLPAFHGFLFYTLSEGVTPALALLLLCAALLALAGRRHWLLVGCVIWALLMVTRPVLAWAGLALLPALVARHRSVLRIAGIAALCMLPMILWWANNCARAGRVVSLHPVYQPDELSINRPTHGAFWALAKSWGARGSDFHFAMETAFRAALEGDTSARHAEHFIQLAPSVSLSAMQQIAVADAFARWQRFTSEQLAPVIRSPSDSFAFTEEEQRICDDLDRVTRAWRKEHARHHHVRVPLRVLKDLVAHSNLNLWIFQHPLRGKPAMEALRWFSALVHVALLAAAALAFLLRVPAPVRLISFGCAAYLFYLAYVQRGIEERYTLPVLFIGVVCGAFVVSRKDAKAQRMQSR